MTVRYIVGDTRDVLATLPDNSVDLLHTSPPFLALRSYLPGDHPDKHREIGSEPDPATFIDTLLALTADWRRVLAPHGTICVELGDTYSGSGGAGGDYNADGLRDGQDRFKGSASKGGDWPLAKCMTLVPELYRIGLAYGTNPITGQASPAGRWRIRNVVRWVRPNPPVGALGDKFRPATSDLVIACTATDRWFDLDAVRVPGDRIEEQPQVTPKSSSRMGTNGGDIGNAGKLIAQNPAGAPPLDWWKISPSGFSGAHYATFPAELCHKPIEAMCPRRVCRTCGKPSRREVDSERTPSKGRTLGTPAVVARQAATDGGPMWSRAETIYTTTGWSTCGCPGADGIRLDGYHTGTGWRPGMVLDPFGGSGITGLVAHGLSRDCILVDLDPRNVDLAIGRLGMFLEVDEPETAA